MTFAGRIRPVADGLLAVLAALALVAGLIALLGISPVEAYRALLRGSVGSLNGISETLVRAIPLMIIGLGVAIAFRSGMINIGAEGQFYMGALGAVIIGLYMPPLSSVIHLPLAMLGGFTFGAMWGAIPGFLRAKWGINEIVITIMMNFIAILFIGYLVAGPMKDTSRMVPEPQSAVIAPTAMLPKFIVPYRAHAGLLIALVTTGLVWFLLQRTVLGYEIKAVGENAMAAAHGGIRVVLVGTSAMALSGGLAGLAGMSEVAGLHHFLIDGISPGYGFLAIAVALIGRLNAWGVSIAAVLFGALMVGAEAMQRAVGVPIATIFLLQGLVVLFVLGRVEIRRV